MIFGMGIKPFKATEFSTGFWDMEPCNLVEPDRRFRGSLRTAFIRAVSKGCLHTRLNSHGTF